MILEVVDIRIHAGQQAAFEAALREGIATTLSQSPGFISARVQHGVESPERYLVFIEWRALDDHMVGFRQGPLFQVWRTLVGPFFASPPAMEHFETVSIV